MEFELTILGSNSAIPAYGRHPTSQVLLHNGHRYLIDCGEGTQFRMSRFKVKRANLDHIFISHLHGDHYFGLVGLINSLRMSGRLKPLTIFGPPKLREILNIQIDLNNPDWGFSVIFIPLKKDVHEKILTHEGIEVYTIPLVHKGMLCNGFLFKQMPKERTINVEAVKALEIPYTFYSELKKGADYKLESGEMICNTNLTFDPPKSKRYAFCSDTSYTESILPYIAEVDLLYHEATFMEAELDKAKVRYHSTAKQAARIASKAKVGKLLLGHYSARYKDLEPLLAEGKSVFENSGLALEGKTFFI